MRTEVVVKDSESQSQPHSCWTCKTDMSTLIIGRHSYDDELCQGSHIADLYNDGLCLFPQVQAV